MAKEANFDAPCGGFDSFSSLRLFSLETMYFELLFEVLAFVVVVVVLLGNPTGLSWPNNRDSEIFLQLLPESVQRRSIDP